MNIMLHNKTHFFKYCTSDALEKVLTKQTFKWSSPTLFNDPFDIQTDFRFGFDFSDLQEPLLQEQIKIVWGANEPEGDVNHPFFKAMLEARRNRITNPNARSREEFENYFREVAYDKKQIEETSRENERWWKGLCESSVIPACIVTN